jgi:hypothetical protein
MSAMVRRRGRVLETYSSDARDDLGFTVIGPFEPFGGRVEVGVAELAGELENVVVSDGNAGEPHGALLHESKCHLAGSAARSELTGVAR